MEFFGFGLNSTSLEYRTDIQNSCYLGTEANRNIKEIGQMNYVRMAVIVIVIMTVPVTVIVIVTVI